MTDDAIRVTPRGPSDAPGPGPGRPGGPGTGVARRPGGGLPVTTELVVFAAVALAVLIAAAVAEDFGSVAAWTLVTVLATAYILSRGLAKHEHPQREALD